MCSTETDVGKRARSAKPLAITGHLPFLAFFIGGGPADACFGTLGGGAGTAGTALEPADTGAEAEELDAPEEAVAPGAALAAAVAATFENAAPPPDSKSPFKGQSARGF